MNKDKMVSCPACGQGISKKASKCPHCNHDCRNFVYRHKILMGFLVFLTLIITLSLGNLLFSTPNPKEMDAATKEEYEEMLLFFDDYFYYMDESYKKSLEIGNSGVISLGELDVLEDLHETVVAINKEFTFLYLDYLEEAIQRLYTERKYVEMTDEEFDKRYDELTAFYEGMYLDLADQSAELYKMVTSPEVLETDSSLSKFRDYLNALEQDHIRFFVSNEEVISALNMHRMKEQLALIK